MRKDEKIIEFPEKFICNEEDEKKKEEERYKIEIMKKKMENCRSLIKNIDSVSLFVRWMDVAFFILKDTLCCYHIKNNNKFVMNFNGVTRLFIDCNTILICVFQFLNDLTKKNYHNFEEMIIATYGRGCNMLYLYNRFKETYDRINEWEPSSMWQNCGEDFRLRRIIDDNFNND